jgi:effector-binding domain-containing protein
MLLVPEVGMAYDVTITEVTAQPLAVVRRRASLAELPNVMLEAFDQVWDFLGEHKVATLHNVVLYLDQVFNLEIGVQITTPLPPSDVVFASETPAGRVAMTTHWGAYEDLPLAHTAIARSVISNGMQVAGPNWEVYGDWDEDPEKRRTDVYYLLR